MLDWESEEIGHKDTGHEIAGVLQTLKSAHYCEDCGKYMGRWISWSNEKVWCKKCWEKKEK